MQARLNYIRLLTSNYTRLWQFYTEKIGLKPRFNKKNGIYDEFATADAMLSIYDKKSMLSTLGNAFKSTIEDNSHSFVIIFQVKNVDQEYELLKKRGITFVTSPTDRPEWIIRTAHFQDPDGNLIELNQPLSKS